MLLFVLGTEASSQQSASLSGRVIDAARSPIAGVTVTLLPRSGGAASRSAISNPDGFFSISAVEAGEYTLRAQRLGYAEFETPAALRPGENRSLEVVLTSTAIVLEGVTAEGLSGPGREREVFRDEAGLTARVVDAATLRALPGLAEADVLRAVQLLPGVVSTSDFSSSYNVRGGSADQNLILLDGFPVFNPFHLGGVFSVFNADAVERAELLAGGFGAEFGGRVSSVLNIESRDYDPDEIEVAGGVSLIATRLLVRGKLPGELGRAAGGREGSWFLSGRRSYIDQLIRPIADFPYHLADLQGRTSVETRGGGRVGITAYLGRDVLDLSRFGLSDGGDAADVLRLRWNWGNRLIGATWDQPIGGAWFTSLKAGRTSFSENLRFVDFGDVRFDNRIGQTLLRADVRSDAVARLGFRAGVAVDLIAHENLAEAGGTTFFASEGDGVLSSAYAALRWRPSAAWLLEPGLRADRWASDETNRIVLSPRFSAKRFFGANGDFALKTAIGRYTQFTHSLRDEELPVSNDTWVMADRSVPHVVSDQVQLGVEGYWSGGWSASVEAYARRFDGVTEFNLVDDPNVPADDLLAGEGRSMGLDVLIRGTSGRLNGWMALSLLRAERTFPDPLAAGWDDLPQTVTYPPVFERRLNLDLVGQYRTAGGIELGGRWNFGSGIPYSRPRAQYLSWRHSPIWGRYEPMHVGPERDGMPVSVVLGRRNSERYPPYHRLDLSARKTFERRWGSLVPYVQVLNVYNRRNVLFYFFDYNRNPPTRSGFSMFPFLPTAGIEVTF